MTAAWGTNAYRAGLALFHGGIIDRLPVPYRGLPRPLLSGKPRIAAVMDRFVVERALVLRPDTMSSLRGGLRRFGLWLDTERPGIDSLAQLTRADLVDFMESVHQMRKIKHPAETISRPSALASSPPSRCSSVTPRCSSGTTSRPGR
jgi:hypothetical protein